MLIVVSSSASCCDEAGIPRKRSLPSLSHTRHYIPKYQNKKEKKRKKKKGNTVSFTSLCFVFIILALCMMVGLFILLLSLFFFLSYFCLLHGSCRCFKRATGPYERSLSLTFDRLENLLLICVYIYPLLVHTAQFHLILLLCFFYSFIFCPLLPLPAQVTHPLSPDLNFLFLAPSVSTAPFTRHPI